MPYQRGGRDYGPSSTGGTTKYSSRRQVSIGVPDRKSRKPVQVRPAKPAEKDPGVAGVSGGLTGRGQAASMAKPANRDPGVMGIPGGLTGRGQNNPALTDPGVMGAPGGVAGRQAPVSRSASSSNGISSPSTYTEPGYPSFNQSYPSDWKPNRQKLDPDITHRGRSEPMRVRTKPLTHPSGGPINSFPWTTDHPLVQANLTKAAFGEPDPAPNAQDWPTYFNLSDVADRTARQQKTDPATGTFTQKVGGFKKDSASSTGKTPTNNPESKAIIGTGRVEYGSAPGSLEADFYTDMMKAAGYYYLQDYRSQRDLLTPGYTPPEPTKWQPPAPDVMDVPGELLGRSKHANTSQDKPSNSKGIETHFPYGTAFLPDHINPDYQPPEPPRHDPGVLGIPGGLAGRNQHSDVTNTAVEPNTADEKNVPARVNQIQPRGSFIGKIDGVEYYTDGLKHFGSSVFASIAGISVSRTHDHVSDTSGWKFGVSSKHPVLAVDSEGNVRVGGKAGIFDVGVIRNADGTTGVFGGVSIGIKGALSLGYRVHGGGELSGPHGTLSTYNHIAAYADGTIEKVEYSPGDHKHPYVKVTISTFDRNGNMIDQKFNNIGSQEKALDMISGHASRIWEEPHFKGNR